jgi:hypothetical protein
MLTKGRLKDICVARAQIYALLDLFQRHQTQVTETSIHYFQEEKQILLRNYDQRLAIFTNVSSEPSLMSTVKDSLLNICALPACSIYGSTSRSSRCRQVRYCSHQDQSKHFKDHKPFCLLRSDPRFVSQAKRHFFWSSKPIKFTRFTIT